MKILKILGIVLLALIGIVLVLGLFAPKDFKVERSVTINGASKEIIFKNISNWNEFIKWNPWMSLDPNIKLNFKGESGKVGSNYSWEGNKDVGKGEMTISALKEFEMVESDLHFIKPFETENKTYFLMAPEGEGYKVTWQMTGKSPFPMNVVGIFYSMDKMIAPDFEKGLKLLQEKCAGDASSAPEAAPATSTDTSAVK